MDAVDHQLTTSERDWADTRAYLKRHRSELDRAVVKDYPHALRVAETTLLSRREWMPTAALRFEDVRLEWCPTPPAGRAVHASPVLPLRGDGSRYGSYAEAVGAIAAPTVFEDRPTYRLLDADLVSDSPVMRFGPGSYFDSINVGEAAAHEAAVARRDGAVIDGVRARITDPCDPGQRPVNVAISTVTIRRDTATGAGEFLLHWRDPRKVGHAGGLYQVVPVGIFQPSGYASWNRHNDFSLWRNTVREFAEELGGASEDHGSERAPIDYEAWDFASRLTRGLSSGSVDAYVLGLGVDPVSFATDLLTAVVIDGPLFDELFGTIASRNAEGRVLEWQPFTVDNVERALAAYPFQAAGAAVLRLTERQVWSGRSD